MTTARATILLSGMVAGDPHQGGATWAVLQYVLGFRRLGHNVLLIEPMKMAALRPAGASLTDSDNAKYFREFSAEFGLQGSAALVLEGTNETVGLPYSRLREIAATADVLLN